MQGTNSFPEKLIQSNFYKVLFNIVYNCKNQIQFLIHLTFYRLFITKYSDATR